MVAGVPAGIKTLSSLLRHCPTSRPQPGAIVCTAGLPMLPDYCMLAVEGTVRLAEYLGGTALGLRGCLRDGTTSYRVPLATAHRGSSIADHVTAKTGFLRPFVTIGSPRQPLTSYATKHIKNRKVP